MADSEEKIVEIKFRAPESVRKKWNSYKGARGDVGSDLLLDFVLNTLSGADQASKQMATTKQTHPHEVERLRSREVSKSDEELALKLLRWWTTPSPDAVHKLVKHALSDLLEWDDRLPKADQKK